MSASALVSVVVLLAGSCGSGFAVADDSAVAGLVGLLRAGESVPLEQLFGTCVSASFFGAYTNDDQIAAVVGATPNESIQYREDVAMVVLERQSGDIEGVFVGRIPVDLDELAGRSVNCVASSLGLDVDGSPQIVHHP